MCAVLSAYIRDTLLTKNSLVPKLCQNLVALQAAFSAWPSKLSWLWRGGSDGQPLHTRLAAPTCRGEEDSQWGLLPADLMLRVVATGLSDEQILLAACVCASWRAAIGDAITTFGFSWAGGMVLCLPLYIRICF